MLGIAIDEILGDGIVDESGEDERTGGSDIPSRQFEHGPKIGRLEMREHREKANQIERLSRNAEVGLGRQGFAGMVTSLVVNVDVAEGKPVVFDRRCEKIDQARVDIDAVISLDGNFAAVKSLREFRAAADVEDRGLGKIGRAQLPRRQVDHVDRGIDGGLLIARERSAPEPDGDVEGFVRIRLRRPQGAFDLVLEIAQDAGCLGIAHACPVEEVARREQPDQIDLRVFDRTFE